MDELSITVTIANRKYKLTVERNEEENVRKAASILDDKVREFSKKYAYKDIQDLLAMVALQYTTSAVSLEKKLDYRENELMVHLNDINKVLDEHVNNFSNNVL